jgi:hypothetical protein
VNPAADNNSGIKIAAAGGYIYMTEMLLAGSRIDPGVDDNFALRLLVQRDILR